MLPRLLYLGDVPVEASYHGSALLYRLLQTYPAERLRIAEGNVFAPRTSRRLPGVTHVTFQVASPRLLHTRFHQQYSRWISWRAGSRARVVQDLVRPFTPEAVLTVAHGYSWVTAARLARETRAPLHLVIHDDWPRAVPAPLRPRVEREFAEVYRQAASRLCVSPFMADEYQRRYGVAGQVLYPSRGFHAPTFSGPADRLRRAGGNPVIAFAGTINSPGYSRVLRSLADCLEPHQGQLLLFGPLTADQAAEAGLAHPRIRLCGLLDPDELLERLRREADALFVPMSFADDDRANMQMGFPSKLTDYTAVGVPLLICGPPSCSAVRWAHENPGIAEIVTSEDSGALGAAVGRLAASAEHRVSLAARAQEVGHRDFSAASAEALFHAALGSSERS